MRMSGRDARGPEDMTRHWSGAPPAKMAFIQSEYALVRPIDRFFQEFEHAFGRRGGDDVAKARP